jgi:cytoskeletal protein RodZ
MWANIWSKIKGFFDWLADGLGDAVPYLVTAVVVIAIISAGIFIVQERKQRAQLALNSQLESELNPDIGEPIAPDVNPEAKPESNPAESGEVAGNTTPEPTPETPPAEEIIFEAPPTGVNHDAPIAYHNNDLGFKITLPARAIVKEQGNAVNFYAQNGELLTTVSVLTAASSLAEIKSQLSLSSDVSGLQDSQFASLPALQYNQRHLRGYVVTKQNQIFYFTGQPNILSTVSL